MTDVDFVYQFCLNEYHYYINSHDKYKDDTKMSDWYIGKANAYAQVMRFIEISFSS